MLNQDYIMQQAQQQKKQKNIAQIQESAVKLKDFLDSIEKIDDEYVNAASVEFATIISFYMNKHGVC
jgi:hypothetical protein